MYCKTCQEYQERGTGPMCPYHNTEELKLLDIIETLEKLESRLFQAGMATAELELLIQKGIDLVAILIRGGHADKQPEEKVAIALYYQEIILYKKGIDLLLRLQLKVSNLNLWDITPVHADAEKPIKHQLENGSAPDAAKT
jgi:hypothetical protein